jgi:hypothetical protein
MSPVPRYAFDAFVDESYDDVSVFTVAGFLAPREAWTRIWQAWTRALQIQRVVAFHAVDCEKRSKDFKGWSPFRTERLQRKLISLICDPAYGLVGFSASKDIAAHRLLLPHLKNVFKFPSGLSVSGPLHDPYFMLFQRVMELVVTDQVLVGYPPKDLVGFTFDRQEKAPNAKAVAEAVWRFRPWGERVRSAGWMDSSTIVPLQIADLLAYETFRFHRDVTLGGGTERWQHQKLSAAIQVEEFHDAAFQEEILALNEENLARQIANAAARRSSNSQSNQQEDV